MANMEWPEALLYQGQKQKEYTDRRIAEIDKSGSGTTGGNVSVTLDEDGNIKVSGVGDASGSDTSIFLTPEMFGADGNGDDSIYFQNMLDEAERTRKIVWIPGKRYYVKNLQIPKFVTVCGEGWRSELSLPASANDGDYIFCVPVGGHIIVKDLVLIGNRSNLSGKKCYGIVDQEGTNAQAMFSHLDVKEFTGCGFYLTHYSMEYRIESCICRLCDDSGMYLSNFMDSFISGCSFYQNGKYGAYIDGSTVKMTNSKAFMNGSSSEGAGIRLYGIHHLIDNVEIQENYNHGLWLYNVKGSMVRILANCNTATDNNSGAQIAISTSKDNRFDFIISGGFMTNNTKPITEKVGVKELDVGCKRNEYYIHEAIFGYKSTVPPSIIVKAVDSDSTYTVNGKTVIPQTY